MVGIEATQGAHYWARVLSARGHSVRLISPHFVKPFLKSQKNDANDAEAICEAVSRPSMRFVAASMRSPWARSASLPLRDNGIARVIATTVHLESALRRLESNSGENACGNRVNTERN